MKPALFLFWLLQSAAPAPSVRHVQLNEYDLAVPIPAGWSISNIHSLGVTLERPGAHVTLDWYQPTRHSRYENFDRRMHVEIREREAEYGTVHTKWHHIGVLRAVEVRFLDKRKNIFVETYLDVPDATQPPVGELFMLTLEGGSGKAGASDLEAYHKILRTLRITERDE